MQYPLQEKIGNPDLFVGREKEFTNFDKWLGNIPKRLSKSRVILARRKSGKTAFVQRVFNRLWSENGNVVPFYFNVSENKIWHPSFAIKYYRAFGSQFISFLERDEQLVREHLTLEEIRDYGRSKSIKSLVRDVDFLIKENRDGGLYDLMWDTACEAPHRFADVYGKRFLVILDEFQNMAGYIYRDKECRGKPDETMPGSYHSLSESKIAPMLVTGSYISWIIKISSKYLEAGRLSEWYMPANLTYKEGLQAVYKYAEIYDEPITNDTAIQINETCMSDPFFISCVMQSNYEERDLTSPEGVVNTINYEITNRRSEMSRTWGEYIQLTLSKINDRNAKSMLLHLSKHAHRYWTHRELKKELQLDIELDEIKRKLLLLVEADVIEWGNSDIQFRGLQDGTLNLILRNRFEEEINSFAPDLKQEFRDQMARLKKENKSLRGTLNNLSGRFAEFQLFISFRSKKRFALSAFFSGVTDTTKLNIIKATQRMPLQREDGKHMELDVVAESSCGRVVVVEVKKWKTKVGLSHIEDFGEKIHVLAKQNPEKNILPAFLSLGGFTKEALKLCEERGMGTAESIALF